MIPSEAFAALFVACAGGAAFVGWRLRGFASTPEPVEPDRAARDGTLAAALSEPGAMPEPFLANFVVSAEGARVGETVFVSATEVVVKGGLGRFLLFPAQSVLVRGADLALAAETDVAAAESAGEAWRARQHDAISYGEGGVASKVKEGESP